MPNPSVPSAVPSATCFTSSSFLRGMNSISTTPSIGRKVPTVSNQFWSRMTSMSLGLPGLRVDDDEDERADGCGSEQQRSVLADPTGLRRAECAAGTARSSAAAVDGAVDQTLVDVLVDEVARALP